MAIIRCAECGREISSEAKICPHCGKGTKAKEISDKATGTVIGWLIGGILLLVMMIIGIVMLADLSYWDRATHSEKEVMAWTFFIGGMIGGLISDIVYIVKVNQLKRERENYKDRVAEENSFIVNPVISGQANSSSEDRVQRYSAPVLYCWKCGAALEKDDLFCAYCGTKVNHQK